MSALVPRLLLPAMLLLIPVLTPGQSLAIAAQEATPGPSLASPPEGSRTSYSQPFVLIGGEPQLGVDTLRFQAGADHIVDQQCPDGGWGWPHDDCSQTFNNITAALGMGLLNAYQRTGDPGHLDAAIAGGEFDLTHQFPNGEPRVDPFTAYFLNELSKTSGDSQFGEFASNFFDQLEDGTYGDNDLDTEEWIQFHEIRRTGQWVNLRPWHFNLYVETAAEIGHPGQSEAMVQGILRGLATLDNTDPDDVLADILGLAGAVKGLALADRQTFPAIQAPLHGGVNDIDNLVDLGQLLISYQNPDGSWFRHSNYPAPTDTDKGAQNTAYAILALESLDLVTTDSLSQPIQLGQSYLRSIQLASGGFPTNPGGGENTTVEAEILWALGAEPAPVPIVEIPTLGEAGSLFLIFLIGLASVRKLAKIPV